MSVTFPHWYEGGWPDQELLAKELAQRYLNLLTPQGKAVGQLEDTHTALIDSGVTVVRVYRNGVGADGLFDPAAVQLAVFSATRADGWAVMEYLRQMFLSYERGGKVPRLDGSVTEIASITEIVGPQLLLELNPDDRLIPATFRINCRRPRALPDYARVRESLSL